MEVQTYIIPLLQRCGRLIVGDDGRRVTTLQQPTKLVSKHRITQAYDTGKQKTNEGSNRHQRVMVC